MIKMKVEDISIRMKMYYSNRTLLMAFFLFFINFIFSF